ncbi:hypothetical protein F0562_032159 [Nyssa sinensis]|uniref:GIR1-like zinc ribbon domain-containing protein n=1 Tax=Nyssa sinensis TaxID=561372 RepID=A0A5J5AXS9_9ASTE|nr:hypothetical protein F0562_032159 [Nyssa sinensis]
MASNLRKSQEGEEDSIEGKCDDGVPTSDTSGGHSDGMISVSTDNQPGKLFLAFQCNHPFTKLDDPLNHPIGMKNATEDQIESSSRVKNCRKRCRMETSMHLNGENTDLDLSLTLSSPALSIKEESLNESVSSSSPSQHSCISMEGNPRQTLKKTEIHDVPALIVMGCQRCYMFVMVSELDPMCPQCKSTSLLDIFRENPAKKTRKI